LSKLVKNTAYYATGNFTSKAVNFLLLPLYTAYLTPDEYGIVASMQVFSGALLIFLTLGLERAIYRLFFDYDDETGQRNFLGTLAISISITSVIVCGILFLFKNPISSIYQSIKFYPYFSYTILTAFFMTYELIPKITLQVKEKAQNYLFLSLVILFLRVMPAIWYVVFLKEGAVGMLKGAMIGNGLTLIFLIPITLKQINLNFDFNILKSTLKYCLPFIPMILSGWIVNMSDRIFIEQFYSTKEVGIYSLGYKIGEAVKFLSVSILMAYNPLFFKLANSLDQKMAKDKLYKINNIIVLVVLYITFTVAFFSKDIIDTLFSSEYWESYKIIPIIALGLFFVQLISLQNLSFYQTKKTVTIMTLNVLAAIINIILNFLLISRYSYFGAAVSTVITQALFFLIIYSVSKKHYFIKYNWRLLTPALLVFIISVTVSLIYIPVSPLWIFLKICLVVTFGLVLYFRNKQLFNEISIN
jgi:O-antigen/teichoic acid export membrane protein